MNKVNNLEMSLKILPIQESDIEELVVLSKRVYGAKIGYEGDELKSQIKIFPEGQLCIKKDGIIVASCSTLIVNFDEYGENHSFEAITDDTFIRNHNPNGDTLYGFDVTVHPDYRNMKLGWRLYEARRKLCINQNLKQIMFGGRVPHYHKYADKHSIEQYIEKVQANELYDPVLTFQLRNNFKIRAILPNYLPDDEESLKYGTLMEWKNEQYFNG